MANPVQRPVEVYKTSTIAFWISVFAALLLQTVLPLRLSFAHLIDLPLLVTIYFSLLRRNRITAVILGAGVGILQDALSRGPIGLFGMAKTLVAYVAAWASFKFNLEQPGTRFLVVGVCVFMHSLSLLALENVLLDSAPRIELLDLASVVLVNVALSLVLFPVLDRFKRSA
jgi:rod shape-determining protein MreD